MILYKTIAKEACAEQIIEKSRFITYIKPISTKEEGDEFIAGIKKKHRDATHNVPCMVVGDKMQIQWASDDGEPQGTSGLPMLQMLVNREITNVCVVVTRYFGGIKLGTGGLVRAYTSSAKLGLEAAGIKEIKELFHIKYEIDYSFLANIENMVANFEFETENIEYTDKVTMDIICDIENEGILKEQLRNITSGKGKIVEEYKKMLGDNIRR